MTKIIASTLLYLMLATIAKAGTHENWKGQDGNILCMFQGRIEKGDALAFKANIESGCRQILVLSLGGDVREAIEMGRIIREKMIAVITPEKGRCVSACVFLYAGGVLRSPYGRIMIHRPYQPSPASSSFGAIQREYNELEQFVKRYLREVNVSESLFDRMMAIPPEDSEALTLEEMEKLGMGLTDPVYAEYVENKIIAKSGLAKTEWLQKKRLAKQRCGDLERPLQKEERDRINKCWFIVFPEHPLSAP